MKFLLKLWPWKVLHQMREDAIRLSVELEDAKAENDALKREIKNYQDRAVQNQKDARKMAQIIALKGGILAIMFMCLSAFGQPLIRNTVDTNSLGNAPTTAYFLGWDGVLTKPKWAVPLTGTNYWDYNGFLFPILSTVVSNANGFSDPGGLVSQNATNHDWVIGSNGTNFTLLIGANATNNDANSTNFTLLVGSNDTNNDNVHAANNTNFSLLIGANATNNDANSTNFALLIGANGTNNDNLHAANNTNFTLLIGSNATNNDANSTNFALLIGSNSTNNDANSTNFSLLIGSNGTNNSTAITNGAINNLSNLVATIGSNGTNNASTKQVDSFNPSVLFLKDDFPGGNLNSLSIGELNWRLQVSSGASLTVAAPVASHPGIMHIATGTAATDGGLLMLCGNTNSTASVLFPALNATTAWTNRWVFKITATNDCVMYMGLVNNLIFQSTEPTDWMGLLVNSTTYTTFEYTCRLSSTSTLTNGPALVTAVWHQFDMYSTTAGTIAFSMDNAAPSYITNNVPTATLNPLVMIRKSAINNSVAVDVDSWSMVMTGLSRF